MKPAQQTNYAVITNVLEQTYSVCPDCLRVLPATIVSREGAVFMEKECPEHGPCTTYVWPDIDHYQWMKNFQFPVVRPQTPVAAQKGCFHDCGLCAAHLRHPTLVELELTLRCNMRCPVCFMAAGDAETANIPDPDLLVIKNTYNAIMAKTGPQTSIQLTGGEPTCRQDLADIVRLGREVGFFAIEVNTNGVVIAQNPDYVGQLAEAGISGIYLQFDGMTSDVYEQIRGENLLKVKLQAIEHCRAAGVQVVLAMTIIDGINQNQLGAVLDFALQNRDVIAGIAYQPAFGSGRFNVSSGRHLTMGDVAFLLAEQSKGLIKPYDLWPLGCSHPLCDSATYLVEKEGKFVPLTRLITPQQYSKYFDPDSPQGAVFGDIATRMFPNLSSGISIVVMNYMDAWSMDLNRLRECSMTVADSEGRMIPFCKYQLTNSCGKKENHGK